MFTNSQKMTQAILVLLILALFLGGSVMAANPSFSGPVAEAVGSNPTIVIPCDVNIDGYADLITTNFGSNSISVLINKKDGTFGNASSIDVGTYPSWAATADFNNDKYPDIAVINSYTNNFVTILFNDQNGGFTAQPIKPIVGNYPHGICAADIDKDGFADLAIANLNDGTISILKNDGHGGFLTKIDLTVGSSPLSVCAGDFNNDGRVDLAANLLYANKVAILLNTGNSQSPFALPAPTYDAGPMPYSVIAADIDRDGYLDLITCNQVANGSVSILINNHYGAFNPPVTKSTGGDSPRWVAAADYNGDGYIDLAVANTYANNVSVLVNDGTGSFGNPIPFPVGNVVMAISAVDMNNDGLSDLAVGQWNTSSFSILINQTNPKPQSWCDHVDSDADILAGWTRIYGKQSSVPSPVPLNGTQVLKFEPLDNACHTTIESKAILRSTGAYNCQFLQLRNASTGLRIYAQEQAQVNPDKHPDFRVGYVLSLNASNSGNGGFVQIDRLDGRGDASMTKRIPSGFNTGEWIQAFLRVYPAGRVVGGYIKNGIETAVAIIDPNPIVNPGGFFVGSCVDGPLANYVDDISYNPDPNGSGCGTADPCATNRSPIVNIGPNVTIESDGTKQICIPAAISDPDDNIRTIVLNQGQYDPNLRQICLGQLPLGSYQITASVSDACGVTANGSVLVTIVRPCSAIAEPDNEFFDDFSYSSADDIPASKWEFTDGSMSDPPPQGHQKRANVSVGTDNGQTCLILRATTGATLSSITSSAIHTKELKFLEGTYGARVKFTDAPRNNADGSVQTFYAIGDWDLPKGHPYYSECDFEYLPYDVWSGDQNALLHFPRMWYTTWETTGDESMDSKYKTSTNSGTLLGDWSLQGWHTLVFTVADGAVKYYIDGQLQATHSGNVYPDSYMRLGLGNWIVYKSNFLDPNNSPGSGPTERLYDMKVDWIYFTPSQGLTSSEVESQVCRLRSQQLSSKDDVTSPRPVAGSPKSPFPHAVSYSSGIVPNVAKWLMDCDVADLYDEWTKSFVVADGCPGCDNGYKRVKSPAMSIDGQTVSPWNGTVSEGIGYGMLISVLMSSSYRDTKADFDGFWKYYKYYSSHFRNDGLMPWIVDATGNPLPGKNEAATDADEDVAFALVLADAQWGSNPTTGIDYKKEATILIRSILETEVESKTNVLKPGTAWGGSDILNLSYFAPAWYTEFAKLYPKTKDGRSWKGVIDKNYEILGHFRSPNGKGLIRDWCDVNGNAVNGQSYTYSYDAVRMPLRVGLDFLFNGSANGAVGPAILYDLSQTLRNASAGDPSLLRDGYDVRSGLPVSFENNAAFVGTTGISAMRSVDFQSWCNALYKKLGSFDNTDYYKTGLKLLSTMVMSGNFPNIAGVNQPTQFMTLCPVDLVVTTPSGQRITKDLGYRPEAQYFEIGSQIGRESEDIVSLSLPESGEYQIQVVPDATAGPDSTFTLLAIERGIIYTLAKEMKISKLPTRPFTFRSIEGGLDTILADFMPNTWYKSWPNVSAEFVRCRIGMGSSQENIASIDPMSIRLNGYWPVSSKGCQILDSIPEFSGKVLEVYFNKSEILNSLDLNTPDQIFGMSITGTFSDNRKFIAFDSITLCDSPAGIIFGKVAAGPTNLLGVAVDLFNDNDSLVGSTFTDAEGNYRFLDLEEGAYSIGITTPLGYSSDAEIKRRGVLGGCQPLSVEANFSLTKLMFTPCQRSRAYWATQLNKALMGKPQDYTKVQFSKFGSAIDQHFNGNPINPVENYVVPQPATQLDSLKVLNKLLNFQCIQANEPFLKRIARGELVALMLNVVAGKVSQTQIITNDGMTLSQAITYCDMLVNDLECPVGVVPAGYMAEYPRATEILRYVKASFVAGLINVGVTLPAGTIPADIMNIAYKYQAENEELPDNFGLNQNYPNPFNPTTTISFSLPAQSDVKLEVFNVLGQRIATLIDGSLEVGEHRIEWDGRDAQGTPLGSGVYLYRLRAGDFIDAKKMVLIK